MKYTASEREGCISNDNELASIHSSEGQLAVCAIRSAGDVQGIKELNNTAEVGTLCVAVVRQSLNQVSRELWGTRRGGAAVANRNKSTLGGPTGISSVVVSAAVALRVLFGRYVGVPVRTGREGAHKYQEACLVLYCKLAGGVTMASPLDGPAFRLRPQLPIVENAETLAREVRESSWYERVCKKTGHWV